MSSAEYWDAVAIERARDMETAAEMYIKQMLRLYDEAFSDVSREIAKIERTFMKRFGVDAETARAHLARAVREGHLERAVRALVETESDEEYNSILNFMQRDGLSVRAYGVRVEHWRDVKTEISLRSIELNKAVLAVGAAARREAYVNEYYRLVNDTAKGLNTGVSFSLVDDKAVKHVMSKPWHGARFSERVWKNTERLAARAQEIVARYIVSGRSIEYAARELQDEFEVAKFRATTLIRTETLHARNQSDLKGYKDMGNDEYRYLATLDERTCEKCQPLDGQVFKVSEAREGVNFPVIHPRCRCTTTINIPWVGRRARDPETGKNDIVGDMTYKEWYDSLPDNKRAALDTAVKKTRNKYSDRKTFEKYKQIFGKDFPKTLDKFQDLKYNNVSEWETLKANKQDRLNQMDFKDMSGLVGKLGNKEVRLWYKTHDENIPNLLDTSKTLEQQARQACQLRNKYKQQARDLMSDQEGRQWLDANKPCKTFEEVMRHKENDYHLFGDDAYRDIIRSSGTTNKEYDRKAGLR